MIILNGEEKVCSPVTSEKKRQRQISYFIISARGRTKPGPDINSKKGIKNKERYIEIERK